MGAMAAGVAPDVSDEEDEASKALARRFELDWAAVMALLVIDVGEKVAVGHGADSRIAKEVETEVADVKDGFSKQPREAMSEMEKEGIWSCLKTVESDGWEWWKAWERERRRKMQKMIKVGDKGKDNVDDAIRVLIGEIHADPA